MRLRNSRQILWNWLNWVLLFPALHESSCGKISSTSVIFIVNSNIRYSTNLNDTTQNAVDFNPGRLSLFVQKLSGLKIYPFPEGLSQGHISFLEVLNPCFAVYLKLPTNWRLNDGVIVVLKSAPVFISVPWITDHLWSEWGATLLGGNLSKLVFWEKKLLFNVVVLFFVKT